MIMMVKLVRFFARGQKKSAKKIQILTLFWLFGSNPYLPMV